MAGSAACAVGGFPSTGWLNLRVPSAPDSSEDLGAGLLTNPLYAIGAKFRLGQFIQRGADSKDAEAIFRRLTDLEPQRWVDEWTKLAEPWERKGAEFAAQKKNQEAKEAYQKASKLI